MNEPIHIISLGAGVQSSTMALMAAKGEITPMPTMAVFADTGDEPKAVYEYLAYLKPLLPFPVFTGSRSRLSEELVRNGRSQIPCFIPTKNGPTMGKRQCTSDWKIKVVDKTIRQQTRTKGLRLPPNYFCLWKGISVDEVWRAKESLKSFVTFRFPLLENRMTRQNCKSWLDANGYDPAPKSSCVYCPFRSPWQWAETKRIGGKDWELCLKVSNQLAARNEFLTGHLKPLDQIDFSTEEERGQLNMFNNECEGMCGV